MRVVILTTPDAQPLDVAGPYEVFALTERKLREMGLENAAGYHVELVTMGRSRYITGRLGLSIVAGGSYKTVTGDIDTLLVVGGMEPWKVEGKAAVLNWIRQHANNVRRLAGVCTGAFVLAEAGLLDGRRATTHWYYCQQLASRYPKVKVDPEPIFVVDGNVYTCAGVTSGMDLALAFVEQDFGTDVAVRIARAYVMFLRRPGGQSQFSTPMSFNGSSQSAMNRLQVWIFDHLAEELTIERLAAQANMSARHFARVFAREFQMTPGEYLDRVRVEAARKRLEDTDDAVEEVATAVGFGTGSTMRRAFLRVLDIGPADYRARFRIRRR
ncbi:MAG: GlxA family transcriptional regulator [Bryobacterales bacterium]|nr:GlxA family transcriptional regulator [Bryobacterales bacterium]